MRADGRGGCGAPLYRRIASQIRAKILDGALAEGARLPTEQALCAEFGVSRITVRHALAELASAGFVESRRGAGHFVTEAKGVLRPRLSGSLDEFLGAASRLRTTKLARTVLAPPDGVRAALELDEAEQAVQLITLSELEGQPIAYSIIWFPVDIGATFLADGGTSASEAIALVIQRSHGISIALGRQSIWPKSASDEEAARLGIAPGSAILAMTRTYFASDGRAVELVNVCYHPERFRFEVTLECA